MSDLNHDVLGILSDLAGKVGAFSTSVDSLNITVRRLDTNVTALDAEVKRHNERMQLDKAERLAERQADILIREAEKEADRKERLALSRACESRHKRISHVLRSLGAKDCDIETKLEETGRINLVAVAKEAGKQEMLNAWKKHAIHGGKLLAWAVSITAGALALVGTIYAVLK